MCSAQCIIHFNNNFSEALYRAIRGVVLFNNQNINVYTIFLVEPDVYNIL